ncbi:hypothetical protein SERLA73DRAFT_73550 [Serpula lacrymans var. lacrymans S7.3]|uniref:Wax synthase domain-containing protein n=2 Tax=Serpula lacrymans var. lacrymans TaxID=341189 RepID=F8PYL1_SERL3|nr:hypothetical protein SERLA73DRAFT_73550 [Serpula lacrymans var. lacrymans S7.3]
MRAMDWAFARQPCRRLITIQGRRNRREGETMHEGRSSFVSSHSRSILWDACDLATNIRYIGWDRARNLYVPRETRSTNSRGAFLFSTLVSAVLHAFLCDMFQYAVQIFSPDTFGSTIGGTIFDLSLPPFDRYFRSSLITFFFGWSVYAVAQLFHDVMTILCVLILQHHPRRWPPMFDAPWRSTSLIDLWSRRWHQTHRVSFIRLGMKPFSYIGGHATGVLGVFTLSGILHDLGLRAVGRGSDFWAVSGFFFMMGVGINLEVLWARLTGKKVTGYTGWLWTLVWVTCWGNFLVDAWLKRGAGGTVFFPEPYRPSRLVMTVLLRLW